MGYITTKWSLISYYAGVNTLSSSKLFFFFNHIWFSFYCGTNSAGI